MIQNIVSQTYVDIREHAMELCGRPVTVLEGKGSVSSHPNFAPIIVVIIAFSGKSSLRVLDIPYAGYSVNSCLFTMS